MFSQLEKYTKIVAGTLSFILGTSVMGMQHFQRPIMHSYSRSSQIPIIRNTSNRALNAATKAYSKSNHSAGFSSRVGDKHSQNNDQNTYNKEHFHHAIPNASTLFSVIKKQNGHSYMPALTMAAVGGIGLGLTYYLSDDDKAEDSDKKVSVMLARLESNDPDLNKLIMTWAKDKEGYSLFKKLVEKIPPKTRDAILAVIGFSCNEFARLPLSNKIVEELLDHYHPLDKVLQQFTYHIAVHFSELLKTPQGVAIINCVVNHDSKDGNVVAGEDVKNFEVIIKYENNFQLLVRQLIPYINECRLYDGVDDEVKRQNHIRELLKYITKNVLQGLSSKLVCMLPSERFLLITYLSGNNCFQKDGVRGKDLLKSLPAQTASEKHLKYLYNNPKSSIMKSVITDLLQEYGKSEELTLIAQQALDKEKELNELGYYTFFHGQRRSYYFPVRLNSFFSNIFKNEQPFDFIWAHIREYPGDIAAKNEEQQIYTEIFKPSFVVKEHYDHLLFMNYALFANDGHRGSNSADWVQKNSNAYFKHDFSAEALFKQHHLSAIYDTYKDEINILIKEYEALSLYGNLLLVAVPKKEVNKYVYTLIANVKTNMIMSKHLDTASIIESLRSEQPIFNQDGNIEVSKDRIEFCLAMTHKNGALNPKSGIKIFPLITGEKEKLKALQEKEKVLLEKMRPDVEEILKLRQVEYKFKSRQAKQKYYHEQQQEQRELLERPSKRGFYIWAWASLALWAAATSFK